MLSLTPFSARKRSLCFWRKASTAVMSISNTVVTCAEVRLLITMCSAMRWRMTLIGSMTTCLARAIGGRSLDRQPPPVRAAAGRRPGLRGRGAAALDVAEDVLLRHPARDPRPGDRVELDAVLGGDAAHDRGRAGLEELLAGRRLAGRSSDPGSGSRPRPSRLRRGRLRCRGLRRCRLRSRGRRRGRLRLRRSGRRGCSGRGGRCGGRRLRRCLLARGRLRGGGRGASRLPGDIDARDNRVHGHRLALAVHDLDQDAIHRRGDLGIDLVGRDLEQRLIALRPGLRPA